MGERVVGLVGPCGAGKSTLAAALRARGILTREIAQEHSYVQEMWRLIAAPDVLIYLDVSHAEAQRRKGREFPAPYWHTLNGRLGHARAHADLCLNTDALAPEAVLARVLDFLEVVP
ncbi:MAG: hypothetical protein JXD18_02665 [Anaerolineae bacterium]|nr:hypothetical protein [Anaerolineae bacterium]